MLVVAKLRADVEIGSAANRRSKGVRATGTDLAIRVEGQCESEAVIGGD